MLTTSLITDIYCPISSDDWQLELLALCKSYLLLLERYDGLLETLLTMESDGPAKVFVSHFKFITQSLCLSVHDENTLLNLLVDYIHGFALAKSCDTKNRLKIDDIEEPFQLICKNISE